jgi:hypothetical protein
MSDTDTEPTVIEIRTPSGRTVFTVEVDDEHREDLLLDLIPRRSPASNTRTTDGH